MKLREFQKVPVFFLLLIFGLSPLLCAKVKLSVRNKTYLSVRDFKRIPEFFTGKEFEGWKVYCRSNPNEREGFYFIVKVSGSSDELSKNAHWKIDWISPKNPESQSIEIPIDNPDIFGKEVFIGLTGEDWTDSSVQPLAWRLRLLNSENGIIAESQSFLWSK